MPNLALIAARRGSLGVLLLLAGGCAAVPAVEGPTLTVGQAREAGRAAAPTEPLAVRWGGTIAEVRNTADGTTVLEIVSRPLRAGGRPRGGDVTDGRFLAEIDTFLDPEIVVAGRELTVTGELAGERDGRVGETPYTYPVVRVANFRYWQPEKPQRHFPHPYPLSDRFDWPHRHPHHRRSGVLIRGGVAF